MDVRHLDAMSCRSWRDGPPRQATSSVDVEEVVEVVEEEEEEEDVEVEEEEVEEEELVAAAAAEVFFPLLFAMLGKLGIIF